MAVLKYYDGSDWEPVVSALQGPTGPIGATGATGVAVGLPTGGVTGAVLAKTSTTDYATQWSVLDYEGAWTSWTPSFTNWALGNGTMDAKYKQIGKTVFFRVSFTLGSTTTKSGQLRLSLPATANGYYNSNSWFVNSTYVDSGTDTYFYTSTMSTTNIEAGYALWNNAGATSGNTRVISATAPFTWATNDVMYFHGFYEAA